MPLPTKYVKVFIGRFQPFHNGHLKTLRAAIDTADLVVVVIGSAGQDRTPKNPWWAHEREQMIKYSLKPAERAKVRIVTQTDLPGNDKLWVKEIKAQVRFQARIHLGYAKYHITLVGCHKDASTYYLKLYRGWSLDLIPSSEALNATDVRNAYFRCLTDERGEEVWSKNLPPATAAFLYAFKVYEYEAMNQLAWVHFQQSIPKENA